MRLLALAVGGLGTIFDCCMEFLFLPGGIR